MKKKILIVNSILYTAENKNIPKVTSIKDTMIYNLALGFKDNGHDVTLIASESYKPIVEEDYDFEIKFLKDRFKLIFKPHLIPFHPDLYSFIKERKSDFDLIISSESFSLDTFMTSLVAKDKVIIWQELNAHNNMMKKLPSKIWYNMIVRLFYRKIRIVGRSDEAKEFIKKYSREVSLKVIDHGVNLNKFKIAKKKKKQFISVAQLIARKNIDGIIDKFASLISNERYEDFNLYIAGRGEQEEYLKSKVSDMGLENKIIFLGFLNQEELNRYVAESYAFLVNTRKDLNMVSIPESIASGTPVITNMVPALAGYIKMNKLGIAKENWDHNSMAEIIENNEVYTANCISFRDKLSTRNTSQEFIEFIK